MKTTILLCALALAGCGSSRFTIQHENALLDIHSKKDSVIIQTVIPVKDRSPFDVSGITPDSMFKVRAVNENGLLKIYVDARR